ncbi:Uncharacterised protein [Shigella sonnei]|nr:Uncharacterised protein [Shigella sonnei]CSG00560.1 Uncharacterised protein [Shigella sonnei]CSG15176.1 Uncharacterised protein [Shigella sonnei]CSI41455.1 Uncharacterised protein [Shigella sonnei]SWC24838.1 Uncharacterised protein [Klebsiella pneumoniae]
MTAVEHAQLHLFIRQHITNQFGSRFFPFWTSGNKVIFYYPLAERFTGNARRIAHTGKLFDFRQRILCHCGHNTVHHC